MKTNKSPLFFNVNDVKKGLKFKKVERVESTCVKATIKDAGIGDQYEAAKGD